MSSGPFFSPRPAVLPLERASVLFDGVFTSPRLQHPEGVAVGPDGAIWCGSENGQILRISEDGSLIEEVAVLGGFTLGLAFDGQRALFACEQKSAAVYRLDLTDLKVTRFTAPGIGIPNYPVVDRRHNRLLVSDSRGRNNPGPGIWSYDLETGVGGIWCAAPLDFANGLALAADGAALLVCETFRQRVLRICVNPDGSAGAVSIFADRLPGLPDGIAFDDHGALFVGCYEPSRILRISANGGICDIYIEDTTAHLLAHPTNLAFDGAALYAANLGRWHVTRIDTDTTGRRLVDATEDLPS